MSLALNLRAAIQCECFLAHQGGVFKKYFVRRPNGSTHRAGCVSLIEKNVLAPVDITEIVLVWEGNAKDGLDTLKEGFWPSDEKRKPRAWCDWTMG